MTATPSDLDESQLAELRDDLGDAFPEFVASFLDAARQLPAELEADLARGALAEAGARAHTLRGTAGYLGAVKTAGTLGRLQRAAEAGDADAARALVRSVAQDLASVAPRLAGYAATR